MQRASDTEGHLSPKSWYNDNDNDDDMLVLRLRLTSVNYVYEYVWYENEVTRDFSAQRQAGQGMNGAVNVVE